MGIKDNLKRGTIEMILLHLLEQEDKYGYQLSQDLEKQSEGDYQLNEALDERKVQVVGKRFRVYYHLTEAGKQHLEETKREYYSVCASVEKVLSYQERASVTPSGTEG